MTISIKRRLLIGLLSLLALTYCITLCKNYYDTQREIKSLFDAQLAQAARVLLELSTHELYEQLAYSNEVSKHETTQVHKYQQEIDFQIWTHGDHLAVRSDNIPSDPLAESDNTFIDREINNEMWRVYAISNPLKTLRVHVAQPYRDRDILSTSISSRLIASFLFIIPFVGLLIIVTVDKAMSPLQRIAYQIKHRKLDNLQPIAMKEVPIEAQPIIKALNSLFCRLQEAVDNITQFTSNAAHELRTPLAAQKIHAQVALQTDNEKVRNEALQEVVSGVNQATSLVEQLLTLARLDPHSKTDLSDSCNLRLICEDKLVELAPMALDKNIDLSLSANNGLFVVGQAPLLGILVRNIVENAIRYTPNNGKVVVKAFRKQNKIYFEVLDSGPGIPEEDRMHVFQRFYRRAHHTQDGTGLGLAMVQRVIEISHAHIGLGESPYGGLRVTVILAAAESELDDKHTEKEIVLPA